MNKGTKRRQIQVGPADTRPLCIELLPAEGYEVAFEDDRPRVGFCFDSQRGTDAIGTDRVRPFHAFPNTLAFVPAGCDVRSRSARGGEYLSVAGLGANEALAGSTAFSGVVDPRASEAAVKLRALLLSNRPVDPLLVACQLEKLVEAATRHASGARPARESSEVRPCSIPHLTSSRLALLDELIEARLAERLSVPGLAAAVQLSPGYLSRAFRRATGLTPHAYLLARRLARARRLLVSTVAPLEIIAAKCGFASDAHLCRVFRHHLGTTPSAYRCHL